MSGRIVKKKSDTMDGGGEENERGIHTTTPGDELRDVGLPSLEKGGVYISSFLIRRCYMREVVWEGEFGAVDGGGKEGRKWERQMTGGAVYVSHQCLAMFGPWWCGKRAREN